MQELAKSGRSKCSVSGAFITKGDIRIGSIIKEAGSYGRWVQLASWCSLPFFSFVPASGSIPVTILFSHCFKWLAHRRVPKKIWLGLPEPDVCNDPRHFEEALRGMSQVLISGLDEIFNLAEERKTLFVRHVMKKTNWADLGKALKVQEFAGRCACSDALSKRSLLDSESLERAGPSKKRSRIQSKEMGAILCCHYVPTLLHFYILFLLMQLTERASERLDGQLIPISKVEIALYAVMGTSSKSEVVVELPAHHGDLSVVPMPSMQVINGAQRGALREKTVVLTGIFPEVGGGCGLNLGKDKVKGIVESFGGKVTGSISGKFDDVLCACVWCVHEMRIKNLTISRPHRPVDSRPRSWHVQD